MVLKSFHLTVEVGGSYVILINTTTSQSEQLNNLQHKYSTHTEIDTYFAGFWQCARESLVHAEDGKSANLYNSVQTLKKTAGRCDFQKF